MRPLTARERRLVALGLLALALGLAWLLLAGPLVGGFLDRAAERRALDLTIQRDQRLMASIPAWRSGAEAQRATAGRFAITAASEQLAVQALQDRMRHIASDQGFAVTSMEDLQADAPPGFVKLRLDATLTLTQLYETFRRLESEDAYVVVDYLAIGADRSLASGRLAPLDVRIELLAAWRPVRGRP